MKRVCAGMIMLLLCLPSGLLLAGMYHAEPLKGMQFVAEAPSISWQQFRSGDLQKELTQWYESNFGLRNDYVRLTNQLYYELFKKSYMYNGRLVVGKDDYIYEKFYFEPYIRQVVTQEELQTLVGDLRWFQNRVEASGKAFCFVISPSKVQTLPEYVPEQYQRFMKNEPELPYHELVRMLDESGVRYVDGQRLMLEEKAATNRILFTKGGTHWNEYGAALAGSVMLDRLESDCQLAINKPTMTGLIYDNQPVGTDNDLHDLMNLYSSADYPAMHTVWQSIVSSNDRQYSVGFIGGSFCWTIVDYLHASPQFEPIDVYFYYRLGHSRFENEERRELPLLSDMGREAWREELLKHDIIVMELNAMMPVASMQEFFEAAKANL